MRAFETGTHAVPQSDFNVVQTNGAGKQDGKIPPNESAGWHRRANRRGTRTSGRAVPPNAKGRRR